MTFKEFMENRKYLDEDIVVPWGMFKGRRVSEMTWSEMRDFRKTDYYLSRNSYFQSWVRKVYREKSPRIDNFWDEFKENT